MIKKNISAIGIFIGMVFGAGIFALPYSIARAGLFWGLIYFFTTFFIILILHLLYAELAFYLPGKHRFVGYVEILLGSKAKFLAFLNTIFSYYGTLLIYAILGGFFLFNIFPFLSPLYWSLIFLLSGSFFLLFNIKNTGKINFYLTILLFISVFILSFLLLPDIKIANFTVLNKIISTSWFFPYGVFIFSFSGFSIIPDITDLFRKNQNHFFSLQSLKELKSVIKISQLIIALFYLIFIASILGVLGANTTENIFYDISNIVGKTGLYITSFIGFLAVLTSFIALAFDFKNVFLLDYKIPLKISQFLIILPLLILLFFINQKFTAIISAVGAIGLGIFGLFILLMTEKFKKQFTSSRFVGKGFNFKSNIIQHSLILKFLIFLLILGALFEFIIITGVAKFIF